MKVKLNNPKTKTFSRWSKLKLKKPEIRLIGGFKRIAMYKDFNDYLIMGIVFIIMGGLKLIAVIAGTNKKINIRQKFNIFYINTVAGAGLFSGLVAFDDWFGELPQMVFIIMSVTYVGFNILDSDKFLNFVKKFFEFITKS